jgi:putative effector of murein hydrolase
MSLATRAFPASAAFAAPRASARGRRPPAALERRTSPDVVPSVPYRRALVASMGAHKPRRRSSTLPSAVSAAASAAFDPDDAAADPDPDATPHVPLAARARALVSRYAPVLLGLALLEGYLRLVTLAMRFAGVTVAPLICALVLLTVALLVSPRLERALSALLRPAVDAVDAQIACVFIPYITAVPVSGLPPGDALRAAAVACFVGYLLTMCIAGHTATLVAAAVDRSNADVPEVTSSESKTNAAPRSSSDSSPASSSARRSFALEARWTAATAVFAALGHLARSSSSVHLPTHVAAAPAYLCATCAVYSLCRRVPPRWQRLGAFPTITGGVAMALISAAMGALVGLGGDAAGGVRLYVAGAGATLLWFVPPAVLGLAFRVHARRRDLASNFAPVFAAVALAVPGGMFLGACVGRLAGLAPELILATVPKCTTTGLAVFMAEQLGVDPSLVAAGCALSGTAGLAAGRATMDALRVRGATARGVATGVSSHAAGTAALAAGGEDEAAAVSGVAFAISGVFAVLLLEAPAFRAALLAVAGATPA